MPRQPLSGSPPQAPDLRRGKVALDVSPQGVGLGQVRLNVLPAAAAAAPPTGGRDALIAAKPCELALDGAIDTRIHFPHPPFQGRRGGAKFRMRPHGMDLAR
jgi:hypothetical protein